MAESGYMWIYLIFLLIPLSRILPRIIKKYKNKNSTPANASPDKVFKLSNNNAFESSDAFDVSSTGSSPKSIDMLVLGELSHGTKNFDVLQKKLGIDHEKLNSVLEDLENKKFMKVVQKQGLFGPKIDLHPTEEGLKKYFS